MSCAHFDKRGAFFDRARPLIEGLEAEHTVLFSVLRLGDGASAEPDLMALVGDGETPSLAAARRAPHNLVLSSGDPAAIPALVEDLAARGAELPGVYGPSLLAERLSLAWCLQTGATSTPHFALTMMQMTDLLPPLPADGGLRLAAASDSDLVADWAETFAKDVGLSQVEIDDARAGAARRLADKTLYIWERDGAPVCLAGFVVTDPSGRAGRINLVYTPPEARGQGYAGACVSTLAHSLLLAGWDYCLIFSDDNNATAGSLYRRIGFEPVGAFSDYLFTD